MVWNLGRASQRSDGFEFGCASQRSIEIEFGHLPRGPLKLNFGRASQRSDGLKFGHASQRSDEFEIWTCFPEVRWNWNLEGIIHTDVCGLFTLIPAK